MSAFPLTQEALLEAAPLAAGSSVVSPRQLRRAAVNNGRRADDSQPGREEKTFWQRLRESRRQEAGVADAVFFKALYEI